MYNDNYDRRMFARFDVDFPAELRMSGAGVSNCAQCRDIAATGVGLMIDAKLAPKAILDLVLRFPYGGSTFRSVARVIWSKQVYEGRWRAGLEFTNVDLMKLRGIFNFARN